MFVWVQVSRNSFWKLTGSLFQYHRKIDKIYLSVLEDYIPYAQSLIDEYQITKVAGIMAGGKTAQDSIYIALKKAAEENDGDSVHFGITLYWTDPEYGQQNLVAGSWQAGCLYR